jgi:hypothetical protein
MQRRKITAWHSIFLRQPSPALCSAGRSRTDAAYERGERAEAWTVCRTPAPLPNIAPNAMCDVCVQVNVIVVVSSDSCAPARTPDRAGSRAR